MTLSDSASRSVWVAHAGHLTLFVCWALAVVLTLAWSRINQGRRTDSPCRDVWTYLAAFACVIGAAVHLAVVRAHFAESQLYGIFFLALAFAQMGWSAATAFRPTRRVLWVDVWASLSVVMLWLCTRTIGIPLGPAAGETESFGVLDSIASLAEAIVVLAASTALLNRNRTSALRKDDELEVMNAEP